MMKINKYKKIKYCLLLSCFVLPITSYSTNIKNSNNTYHCIHKFTNITKHTTPDILLYNNKKYCFYKNQYNTIKQHEPIKCFLPTQNLSLSNIEISTNSMNIISTYLKNKYQLIFNEIGLEHCEKTNIFNFGIGYRYHFHDWLLGCNICYCTTISHIQKEIFSIGSEFWTNNIRIAINNYFDKSIYINRYDYCHNKKKYLPYAFDIHIKGFLPHITQVNGNINIKYSDYKKNTITTLYKQHIQNNEHHKPKILQLMFGLNYTPIPIVTFKIKQTILNPIKFHNKTQFNIGVIYKFNTPFTQQIHTNNMMFHKNKKQTLIYDISSNIMKHNNIELLNNYHTHVTNKNMIESNDNLHYCNKIILINDILHNKNKQKKNTQFIKNKQHKISTFNKNPYTQSLTKKNKRSNYTIYTYTPNIPNIQNKQFNQKKLIILVNKKTINQQPNTIKQPITYSNNMKNFSYSKKNILYRNFHYKNNTQHKNYKILNTNNITTSDNININEKQTIFQNIQKKQKIKQTNKKYNYPQSKNDTCINNIPPPPKYIDPHTITLNTQNTPSNNQNHSNEEGLHVLNKNQKDETTQYIETINTHKITHFSNLGSQEHMSKLDNIVTMRKTKTNNSNNDSNEKKVTLFQIIERQSLRMHDDDTDSDNSNKLITTCSNNSLNEFEDVP